MIFCTITGSNCSIVSLLNFDKGKGDHMECGNYRGIKLLEHAVTLEKIIERRLCSHKQLQEKHLEVNRDLYITFVDVEKAYDCIPRELVY